MRPREPLMPALNFVRRGDGEPLLLLHSLGGTISQWNPVLDRLAERREVVAVDMPGFGDSPPLPEGSDETARNLAAAVLDFVATLDLGGLRGSRASRSAPGWRSSAAARAASPR